MPSHDIEISNGPSNAKEHPVAMDEKKASAMLADVLDARIAEAGHRQHIARGSAPEKKPRTWEEIEAYAEWVASIRVREELLALKREVA